MMNKKSTRPSKSEGSVAMVVCTKAICFVSVLWRKNIIRDGGSTALYAAYTVDTVDMVYTVDTAYTIYTIEFALHC